MLKVVVPLPGPVGSPIDVDSAPRSATVSLALRNGIHTFRSQPIAFATLADGSALTGIVEFGYEYDEPAETVTVSGPGYPSQETLRIVPARTGGWIGDEAAPAEQHPRALHAFLTDAATAANDAVISALASVPGLNVGVRRAPSASPSGLYAVYRDGEFLELYSPRLPYGSADRIVRVESVYNKTLTLSPKSRFRNVIGSTRDPKVRSMPWLKLWQLHSNVPITRCSSWQFPAVATPGVQKQSNFACNQRLVGGHIVLGAGTRQIINPGTNATVMIIPICSRHNGKPATIMKPVTNRVAILLDRYMR